MQKFQRWAFEHKSLATVLFSFFLCIVYTGLLLLFHAPWWLIIIVDLFMILATYCYVDNCTLKLLQSKHAILREQCDPYPYLHQVEEVIARTKSEARKQLLTIDLCMGYVFTGDFRKAYDIMSAINIDQYYSTLPQQKLIYYNNLADLCVRLHDNERALIWFQKAEQMYLGLKDSKFKTQMEHLITSGRASVLYLQKDYAGALERLNSCKPQCLLQRVEDALLCARIYVAQGKTELAKQKLQYVIANGNRTCLVSEAQELLKILET